MLDYNFIRNNQNGGQNIGPNANSPWENNTDEGQSNHKMNNRENSRKSITWPAVPYIPLVSLI